MKDRTLTVKTVKTVDVNDIGGELWSGAQDRWRDADDDTREAVFDRICDWTEDEEEVDMTTVNDLIWFECDDLFFPEDDEDEETEDEDDEDDEDSDEEEDTEDEENTVKTVDANDIFVNRYGVHPGRITCDGCHSVFKGNPFVDDGGSEYCSKECAEANGATDVHEDVAECEWCHYHSYGCWWSDNDGNFFCSPACAILYNVNVDERIKDDDETEDNNA